MHFGRAENGLQIVSHHSNPRAVQHLVKELFLWSALWCSLAVVPELR